jgi:hypothetical protein
VIGQCPKTFGTQRYTRVECPGVVEIDLGLDARVSVGVPIDINTNLNGVGGDQYTPHMPSMETSSTNSSSSTSGAAAPSIEASATVSGAV